MMPMVKPTVVLKKHQAVKIADPYDNIPDVFTMGLAWEMTGGRNIDLDASCIMLDANLSLMVCQHLMIIIIYMLLSNII